MSTENLDIVDYDSWTNAAAQKERYNLIDLPKDRKIIRPKQAGVCSLVIIPYRTTCSPYTQPGKLWTFRDYFVFRNLGFDGKGSYFDVHSTTQGKERCAITDALAALPEEARKARKSQRKAALNVLILEGDKEPVLAVLDHSFACFLAILQKDVTTRIEQAKKAGLPALIKKAEGIRRGLVDPRHAIMLTFSWLEKQYAGRVFVEAGGFEYSEYGDVSSYIEQAVDLDAALNFLPYDEVADRWLGGIAAKTGTVEVSASTAKTRPEATTATAKRADPVQEGPGEEAEKADLPYDSEWDEAPF